MAYKEDRAGTEKEAVMLSPLQAPTRALLNVQSSSFPVPVC